MEKLEYERRKHKRIRTNYLADIYLYSYFSPKFLTKGVITDLSISGIKIEAHSSIKDVDLLITFTLPGDEKFYNIRGRVIRDIKESFTHIYGIKFVDMKFKDKLKIWIYILKHTKISSDSQNTK